MIPRTAFTPIAIALIAATLLTAFWSFFALNAEFHYAKWIVDAPPPPLPLPAAFLRAIHPFIWLLPFSTVIFASWLHRPTEITVTQLSWFVSSVTFALFSWLLLIAVAFFCIYMQYFHYIDL